MGRWSSLLETRSRVVARRASDPRLCRAAHSLIIACNLRPPSHSSLHKAPTTSLLPLTCEYAKFLHAIDFLLMGSILDPSLAEPPPKYSAKSSSSSNSHPIIYSRDFAYADNGPIVVVPSRMVRADILTGSARTFAEYVLPRLPRHPHLVCST